MIASMIAGRSTERNQRAELNSSNAFAFGSQLKVGAGDCGLLECRESLIAAFSTCRL